MTPTIAVSEKKKVLGRGTISKNYLSTSTNTSNCRTTREEDIALPDLRINNREVAYERGVLIVDVPSVDLYYIKTKGSQRNKMNFYVQHTTR